VATKLVMPYMSARMERGQLVNWRKQAGDPIAYGDVIADIESDRAYMALKCYVEGVLLQQLVSEGTSVAVGEPIAIIGERNEVLVTAERHQPEFAQEVGEDTRPQDPYLKMPQGSQAIISPILLTCDLTRIGDEVRELVAAGADWIHVDVMDGHFVPDISVGAPIVSAVRRVTELPLDVHLMVDAPERHIKTFVDAGADIITFHLEATAHVHHCIEMIHHHNVRAGVAINPHTRIEALEHVIPHVDLILIMLANHDHGQQRLLETCTDKVQRLRRRCEHFGFPLDIAIEGGIRANNIATPAAAGANVFVSNSNLSQTNSYAATIADMRQQLRGV